MDEAVIVIIDHLSSWDAIVAEVAKNNSLGLPACNQIEHEVAIFLQTLTDDHKRNLWLETEVGMMHSDDAESLLIDSVVMDLEVALFETVTNTPWEQAGK
ncbi:MAG: hypothetical protein B6D35_06705 [Candidatus Brocadia sp. UTAMX2]|jgi:hypothetical protein|nr:MAG: hypothetical protein B6D35_06705 [Candidatus Brocadia sp. UTAMX2]